ncbi:transglutaminase domain-containing protein [Kangiella sp. HD9-110m-PIT-SAG07]|nr:transglutaminase domain-containing protein [Kangiella sp. HD9-110m-PIT-SAG07]
MKSTVNRVFNTLLKLSFLAACLLLLSSYLPFKRLWQPASVEPFTEWFQINWQGQVVGWGKKQLEVSSDAYEVTESEHFEGRVRGQRVKFIYQHQYRFDRKPPHNIIEGKAKLVEPNLEMITEFTNSDELFVTQTRNQISGNFIEPSIKYTLDDYLYWRQFIETKPEQNEKVQLVKLEPHAQTISTQSFTVTQTPQGRHQRYELTNSSGKQLELSLKGHLLTEYRERGITFVRSTHKPSFNPEMQTDLYSNVGLGVNKPLGDINRLQSLTLSFKSQPNTDNSNGIKVHPSAQFKQGKLITRNAAQHPAQASVVDSWTFQPVSSSIENLSLSIDLPADSSTSHKAKVKQLVGFVHNYLYYQPTPTSFTTDEVISNGYGDCTEYTQLLLALLNQQQIPAREVSGYIYLGDDEQRFGGHAWVEVLLDENWVGVDPTWNLTQVTAGHLPITIPAERSVSDLDFIVEQIH